MTPMTKPIAPLGRAVAALPPGTTFRLAFCTGEPDQQRTFPARVVEVRRGHLLSVVVVDPANDKPGDSPLYVELYHDTGMSATGQWQPVIEPGEPSPVAGRPQLPIIPAPRESARGFFDVRDCDTFEEALRRAGELAKANDCGYTVVIETADFRPYFHVLRSERFAEVREEGALRSYAPAASALPSGKVEVYRTLQFPSYPGAVHV